MATPSKDKLARYQALLARVQALDLGSGGYWKPPVGRSTIRIMPPIGNMEPAFFVEGGQHFFTKGKVYLCPSMFGTGPCPICETNEGLYNVGKKKAAAPFRAGKTFFLNIIVRASTKGGEDQGPLIWQCGTTIMSDLVALISDPDYGDISDLETGTDLVLTRTGEGKGTTYQVTAKRNPSPLGSAEAMEKWVTDAKDLVDEVKGKLFDYEKLAIDSGVSVYLTEGLIPEVPTEEEAEPETEEATAEDESEQAEEEAQTVSKVPTASASIQAKLKARMAASK